MPIAPAADLQYPIGRFSHLSHPKNLDAGEREAAIAALAATPAELRQALAGLGEAELDTPYRPGGWTVRQVVHHLPDSHLNAYLRMKLALTEDDPLIRTYHEERWAELDEARTAPVEASLELLTALHRRWDLAWRSLRPADWQRTCQHPELGPFRLESLLAMYAWHGRHHVAHITALRRRQNW